MRDDFYLELRNVCYEVDEALKGQDVKKNARIVSEISDAIDLIQRISITVLHSTILDLLMELGGLTEVHESIFKDYMMIYVDHLDEAVLDKPIILSDEALIKELMARYYSYEKNPVSSLIELLYIRGIISMNRRESLEVIHKNLIMMLPEQIKEMVSDRMILEKNKEAERVLIESRIDRLCLDDIQISPEQADYQVYAYVEKALDDMEIQGINKLIGALDIEDLVNTMDMLGGKGRRRLFTAMDQTMKASVSKKVFSFGLIASSGVFKTEEVLRDYDKRIVPSTEKFLFELIKIVGRY